MRRPDLAHRVMGQRSGSVVIRSCLSRSVIRPRLQHGHIQPAELQLGRRWSLRRWLASTQPVIGSAMVAGPSTARLPLSIRDRSQSVSRIRSARSRASTRSRMISGWISSWPRRALTIDLCLTRPVVDNAEFERRIVAKACDGVLHADQDGTSFASGMTAELTDLLAHRERSLWSPYRSVPTFTKLVPTSLTRSGNFEQQALFFRFLRDQTSGVPARCPPSPAGRERGTGGGAGFGAGVDLRHRSLAQFLGAAKRLVELRQLAAPVISTWPRWSFWSLTQMLMPARFIA